MASHKSLFIVSFGDSRKFRTSSAEKIKSIADALRNMLSPEFEGVKITRFLIPTIDEVQPVSATQYADLPKLDKDALQEIAATLRVEITNWEDQKKLDLNAPFDEINPEAVAPGQI